MASGTYPAALSFLAATRQDFEVRKKRLPTPALANACLL